MKWDEIPRFIATEHCYHINTGIRGYVKWVEDEEKELNLQMNPDFQRGHVWTEKQQSEYVEYLLHGGQSGRSFYFNLPTYRKSNNPYIDYVCVDGLQRTTAIQRFINGELKAFDQYYIDFGSGLVRTEFQIDIHVNDLKTKQDVLTWYVQMNSGGTPHTKEEIEKVKQMIEEVK